MLDNPTKLVAEDEHNGAWKVFRPILSALVFFAMIAFVYKTIISVTLSVTGSSIDPTHALAAGILGAALTVVALVQKL